MQLAQKTSEIIMLTALIIIFVVAYAAIALEHPLNI
jgi:hypothetical protein